MNRPPEIFLNVQEDRLLDFSTTCFQKSGLNVEHATLISRLLVHSDLRGVRSHGTRTVNGYCLAFEKRAINTNPKVRTLHETPTAVVVDGDGTLGYFPTIRATEVAITKAKEMGLGLGLVRHLGITAQPGTMLASVWRQDV